MRCIRTTSVWLACLAFLAWMLAARPLYAAPPFQPSGSSVPVYGIEGRFAVLANSPFGEIFVTADGTRLTTVGVNATVAQQIDVLARQMPPPTVRVWGTRNFDPKADYISDLVVSEILPEGDPAQPPPQPTQATTSNAPPTPQVTAVINFNLVNLYNTPGQSMSVVGQARAGERCNVQGRDATGAWLLADCGGTEGWLDRRLVNVTGELADVPFTSREVTPRPPPAPLQPTPTPPPVAPPPTFQGWKASYYNNPTLSGAPAAFQDTPTVDFDWGFGSPAPGIPVDYFSATFERTYNFPQGYYKINALADDGVRIFIDRELVIDEWHQASGIQYTASRWLSGVHSIRIEYLELVGGASIRYSLEFSPNPPPWQATYYEGAPNRGAQKMTQGEFGGSMQLQRTWSNQSPFPNVLPADGWNGRWVGRFDFAGGNYLFRARADDGVRVYLNDTMVINGWSDGPHDLTNSFRNVGPGTHTITVDYYDRFGYAYLQVFWFADQFGPNYVP
jgi:hypothetical protein